MVGEKVNDNTSAHHDQLTTETLNGLSNEKDFEIIVKTPIRKSNSFDLEFFYKGTFNIIELSYRTISNENWSEFIEIDEDELFKPFIESVLKNEDLYVKFRVLEIQEPVIVDKLTINTQDRLLEDKYFIRYINLNENCKTITKGCSLFKPFDGLEKIGHLQMCTSDALANFGIEVKYFKVNQKIETTNFTLKTWQEYVTEEPKRLNIVIPPDTDISTIIQKNDHMYYNDNDFEIHIPIGGFKRAFGENAKPEKLDFFIFKEIRRVLEVVKVEVVKGANFMDNYYSIIFGDFREKNAVENDFEFLLDGANVFYDVEEGEETIEEDLLEIDIELGEQRQVIKPKQQQQTISYDNLDSIGDSDAYRRFISNNVLIQPFNLKNFNLQLSTHVYRFEKPTNKSDVVGVVYKNDFRLSEENRDMSMMFWFKMGTSKDRKLLSLNDFELSLDAQKRLFLRNGNINNLTSNTKLETGTWYGVVCQISYLIRKMSISLYTIPYLESTSNRTAQLYRVERKLGSLNSLLPANFESDSVLYDVGGGAEFTNIKAYSSTFEEDSETIEIQKTRTTNKNLIILDLPRTIFRSGGVFNR